MFSAGSKANYLKMTETDYDHECMRAELLGIDKPNREEFFSRKKEEAERENDEPDVWSTGVTEELGQQGEGISRASGGLDELNNILSVTQKKINHLKTVCGSFTRILKLHTDSSKEDVSRGSNETSSSAADEITKDASRPNREGGQEGEDDKESEVTTPSRKPARTDIHSAVGSQLSKLDSLISKAERADISLSSQNKQMKKFLN